jgi:hypothetical protein
VIPVTIGFDADKALWVMKASNFTGGDNQDKSALVDRTRKCLHDFANSGLFSELTVYDESGAIESVERFQR